MKYSAYPDYDMTDAGVSHPKDWAPERLRFSIKSNPVKSEVNDWDQDKLVSFIPMDAVGEYGGIDTSQEKPIGEVYGGYTYFTDGDVLIAKITPCFENGKGAIARCLANGVGFGTTEFHVIRPLENISERWLFYLTVSDAFRKNGGSEMLGAGGQKRVPEEFIKDFRIGIPSPAEQDQIADFLDWKTGQIDAQIAKKRQLIEKLQEQRIAVITQAVTKSLNPEAPMRDSGTPWLGQVPEHWEVKRLRYCAGKVTSGSRGWAKYFSDQGSLFLRITNLDRDSIELKMEDLERVDPPEGTEGARTLTQPGDILISITADLGSVAVIPAGCEPAYVSQHLALVRLDTDSINPAWVAYSVFSDPGKSQLLTAGYGGTKVQLSLSDIKEICFCHPPTRDEQDSVLEALGTRIEGIDGLVRLEREAIHRLTEYRAALITAATTGKIDVRNVKQPVAV